MNNNNANNATPAATTPEYNLLNKVLYNNSLAIVGVSVARNPLQPQPTST